MPGSTRDGKRLPRPSFYSVDEAAFFLVWTFLGTGGSDVDGSGSSYGASFRSMVWCYGHFMEKPIGKAEGFPFLVGGPVIAAWTHRQLLRQFVVRDIKGRFAGSAAGILWAVINPLATIVVYLFVFSLVLRVTVSMEEAGTTLFSLFFLSGLLPWLLFAEGLSRSVGCLRRITPT